LLGSEVLFGFRALQAAQVSDEIGAATAFAFEEIRV
jgi:hypothetical protein